MADLIEEVKSKVDIVSLVSQYVQLKKAGQNYKGLCPFHSEKTPSFVVSPEKQICHCFGCNKGGDVISFMEEMEGVDFAEALTVLADRAGIKVKDFSKFKKAKKSEKDEYFKAHELASEFFVKQLYSTNDGKKVLDYLHRRGLNDETIKNFKVGFAPDKYDGLYPQLLKKGIGKNVLVKSGLVTAKNLASDEIYDKFRSRLIFPIFDYMGRICGFGGRALKKEQAPKYLNSAENIIYNKSKVLYGLYHSKQEVKKRDQIILVEGYFDVLVPFQEGVKNVVATSGTALTKDHVKVIDRICNNAVTCFDKDSAGFEATIRSYALLKEKNLTVKTIGSLSEKDPADYVRAESGEAFLELAKESKDFVSYYISKLIEANDVSSIVGRKVVMKELLPLLKRMSSSEIDFYIRLLSKELNIKEQFLYDEIESFKLPTDHPARQSLEGGGEEVVSSKIALEDLVLGILLEYPETFEKVVKKLKIEGLKDDHEAIYKLLSDQYNSSRTVAGGWKLEKGFSPELRAKVDIVMLAAADRYGQFSEDVVDEELIKLIDRLNKNTLNNKLERLRGEIVEAEKSDDKGEMLKLLKEQQELLSGDQN